VAQHTKNKGAGDARSEPVERRGKAKREITTIVERSHAITNARIQGIEGAARAPCTTDIRAHAAAGNMHPSRLLVLVDVNGFEMFESILRYEGAKWHNAVRVRVATIGAHEAHNHANAHPVPQYTLVYSLVAMKPGNECVADIGSDVIKMTNVHIGQRRIDQHARHKNFASKSCQ